MINRFYPPVNPGRARVFPVLGAQLADPGPFFAFQLGEIVSADPVPQFQPAQILDLARTPQFQPAKSSELGAAPEFLPAVVVEMDRVPQSLRAATRIPDPVPRFQREESDFCEARANRLAARQQRADGLYYERVAEMPTALVALMALQRAAPPAVDKPSGRGCTSRV